jgi:hypothetical protein
MKEDVYSRYNTDDVFNRSVIGGLLHLLNHKITYEQIWEDDTVETVTVPFVYNFVSSEPNERFIQDNYTFFGRECFSDKIIDGNFEILPRFVLSYDGSQIDSSNITNRFVKGTYQKQIGGVLESYTAYTMQIPLTMNFSIEGWIDNYITAFKIEQAIRDIFYKNKTFWVQYKGTKIGCCVGFPESMTTGEKTVTYSFSQDNQIKMSFSLSVETYQPCFDMSTSIENGNVIEHVALELNRYHGNNTEKNISIKFKELTKSIYNIGDNIRLEWDIKSDTNIKCPVVLYYITSDGDKHIIDMCEGMVGGYEWKVPQSISKIKQPNICIFDNDELYKIEDYEIIVSPNIDGFVTSDSFKVLKPGKFSGKGYLQLSCDYIDDLGNVIVHDCYVAEVDGENGVVAVFYHKDSPITLKNMINNRRLKYKNIDYKSQITLKIVCASDNDIYDEMSNILII